MRTATAWGRFYLWWALGLTAVTFWGFSYTYFGPIAAGRYPAVSPAVHVHGWSFFLFFLLLPLQAGLIATRKVRIHQVLGTASPVLAVVMVFTGLLVLSVRLEAAFAGETGPPWLMIGPAVLEMLVLFTVFYGAALWHRKRPELHKRFIVVASSAALGPASSRIFLELVEPEVWVFFLGIAATNVFILAAMAYDWISRRSIHPVYILGIVVCLGADLLAFPFARTDAGQAMNQGIASLAGVIGFLY